MKPSRFPILLALVLGACAAPQEDTSPFARVLSEPIAEPTDEAAAAETPDAPAQEVARGAAPVEATSDADRVATAASYRVEDAEELEGLDDDERPERYGLTDAELDVWRSPRFRREFALSYLGDSEVEPPVTVDELETMERVMEYISEDRMDKAQKLLQKKLDDGSSAVFDYTLGSIHFQLDEVDEALALYEKSVAKYPKFRRAWATLGMSKVRNGDFEGALPALTRVIELGGGNALTYGMLGYAYSNVENHISAESAYRMAVLLDPETADWREGLARSFFKQERFQEAAALCASMIDREPENANLWLLQANAYIGLGQHLRAAENFELVDGLGASTPESLFSLGDIYVNEQLFDLGVDAYVKALESSPEASVERPLRAAKVLTAHGELDETRRLLERVTALRPTLDGGDRKELLKLQARVASADGGGDEEARVLEEIVALDPLDGEALILLGRHARGAGDDEKAVFWFERAAAIEAFEADAKVQHAQLLAANKDYREAIKLLKRAQELRPRDNVQAYLEQVERIAQSR